MEMYNGQRARIMANDGNIIDTMFVDNRAESTRGKTLIICCEGNSGFYEIGIMMTPVKAGYSALGWNHPGFVGSTVSRIYEKIIHVKKDLSTDYEYKKYTKCIYSYFIVYFLETIFKGLYDFIIV